jgi:uncharacterized protein YjbI with pentapeptide repeats
VSRWLLLGLAAIVLAIAVAWVLFVPVTNWLAGDDVGAVKGTALASARDSARGQVLTLGAGLLAAGALAFTALSFRLSREGQVTDRYTKAIEQLGSDKLDIRIGGIYALERIARDSARDHPTVMEVLTAFIREHSYDLWDQENPIRTADLGPPRADVQAATTVIARRNHTRDIRPLDLSRANLSQAKLSQVNLHGADLAGAILHKAAIAFVDLGDADLTRADLTGATFVVVELTRANLTEANLTHAAFTRADLMRANLRGAQLADTSFLATDLTGSNLARASLVRADLTGAKMNGVDFTAAVLNDAELPPNLEDLDLSRANLTGALMTPGVIPAGWETDAIGRLARKPHDAAGSADGESIG